MRSTLPIAQDCRNLLSLESKLCAQPIVANPLLFLGMSLQLRNLAGLHTGGSGKMQGITATDGQSDSICTAS